MWAVWHNQKKVVTVPNPKSIVRAVTHGKCAVWSVSPWTIFLEMRGSKRFGQNRANCPSIYKEVNRFAPILAAYRPGHSGG